MLEQYALCSVRNAVREVFIYKYSLFEEPSNSHLERYVSDLSLIEKSTFPAYFSSMKDLF